MDDVQAAQRKEQEARDLEFAKQLQSRGASAFARSVLCAALQPSSNATSSSGPLLGSMSCPRGQLSAAAVAAEARRSGCSSFGSSSSLSSTSARVPVDTRGPHGAASTRGPRLPQRIVGELTVVRACLSRFAPHLCCDDAVLASQTSNWTCGYENLGALLRTLVRCRPDLRGLATDVRGLQGLIERAWAAGYDPESAAHFGSRLVGKRGKSGWVGAPEWLAALSFLRIDACIIEIEDRKGAVRAECHHSAPPAHLPPSQPRKTFAPEHRQTIYGCSQTIHVCSHFHAHPSHSPPL